MDYKILSSIALGEPGNKISEDQLLEAGVNIDALISSGHLESTKTVNKTVSEPKE
jgi:hypothetical protein